MHNRRGERIVGYIMEKLKKRGGKYYIIDWIISIALMITFIYFSYQVREMMLTCTCPSPFNITNYTFNNSNFTGVIGNG